MNVQIDQNGNVVESNILIKIQKIEYLKQIQNGVLYMKNLDFFRKLESKGIGDSKEGFITEFKSGQLLANGVVIADIFKANISAFTKCPVFCFMSIKLETVETGNYRYTIPKKFIEEFAWDEKSEYGIILVDKEKFEEKVDAVLKELNLSAYYGYVDYIDDFTMPKKEELYKVAFRKRKTYEEQNEYRLMLNVEVDDNYILEIGDISDFSKILPITKYDDMEVGVVFDERNA